MMLTRENLSNAVFENEDARLLIADVVSNTSATVYYYPGIEISVMTAIKIWNKAMRAEAQYNAQPYSVSFINLPKTIKDVLYS